MIAGYWALGKNYAPDKVFAFGKRFAKAAVIKLSLQRIPSKSFNVDSLSGIRTRKYQS